MARIKDGFKLCPVGDEYVVVAQGLENTDFSKVISLNDTGAYLWRKLEATDFDTNDIAALLLEAYEVDEPTALRDSVSFFEAMQKACII